MKLATKDTAGLVLVVGTLSALLLHNGSTRHRETHVRPVVDAGGAVTSAVEVPPVAFHDVNVVPMDGDRILRRQVVVVRSGFVTRIGDVGVVEPPAGARVIHGGGTRYLAPGLTDAHVHLGDRPEEVLPLFLANGVTTVFNLDGERRHLAVRERVGRGELAGPTIYTAGPFADGSSVRSPADAQRFVRGQKQAGYDFVKLHGDLDRESFEALARAGRDEGIPIVGHAPRELPISAVLEQGQAAVSHAEELIYTEFMTLEPSALGDVAAAMATSGTWLMPGISTFENTLEQWGTGPAPAAALAHAGAEFLPPSLRKSWASSRAFAETTPESRARIADMLAFHGPLVESFHAAGVRMLAGTDAGLPGMVPGFSLHDELQALREAGLSGFEALATATSQAGRFIRERVDASARFGTVEVGARADLLLLDGDPRETLTVLRRPLGVMIRGRWLDRAALDQMLTPTRAER